MPQQSSYTNGHSNGHNGKYDMEDGQTFLFTSESVGEGHPGEYSREEICMCAMCVCVCVIAT